MQEIAPVLRRRAPRWSDDSEAIVQSILSFARTHPPPELLTSALRTLLYAWCTAARFARPVGECLFCAAAGGDSQ